MPQYVGEFYYAFRSRRIGRRRGERKGRESDWDTDIENARDHRARVPLGRPSQLSKVLIFQSQKPPVGWQSGVRPVAPPNSNPVPELENADPEPEMPMAKAPSVPLMPEMDTDNDYEPVNSKLEDVE